MAFDAHTNGAYSTVLTAPSPASSGTSLVVQSADGTRFPAVPFNATVWPAGNQPLFANGANAEIVRVTAISTDTFTITRTQEGTSARSIVVGDQIAATITKKTVTDVENMLNGTTSPTISSIVNTGTLTLPTSTDTLVGRDTTDTMTNKDLSSSTNTFPSLKVYDYTLPTSSSSFTISGLDLNAAGGLYDFIVMGSTATAADMAMVMNGTEVATNWTFNSYGQSIGTFYGTNNIDNRYPTFRIDTEFSAFYTINRNPYSGYITVSGYYANGNSTAGNFLYNMKATSKTSISNVTSILLNAGTLAAGTRIIIMKKY